MSEWISIDKRKPVLEVADNSTSVDVLVIDSYGNMFTANLWDDGEWCDCYNNEPVHQITHWQPLPEPPK